MRKSAAAISPPEVAESAPVVALHARVRREQMRWLALSHLDVARPQAMTDLALLALIQTVYPEATVPELRRELQYLALRDLLTSVDKYGRWRLSLTYQGIDVVEYTDSCPPGIGRPLVESD